MGAGRIAARAMRAKRSGRLCRGGEAGARRDGGWMNSGWAGGGGGVPAAGRGPREACVLRMGDSCLPSTGAD